MLGTLEPSKPVLGTRVFVDLVDPLLATWNLEILPGTLTENLRNSWGLYLESLLGALEPSETLLKNLCWEPRPSLGTFQNLYSYLDGTYILYLEPRNLPEPLLGTLARNFGTFWNPLWLEPLLGASEPAGTFAWNPYTSNLGTFRTLLGNLTWNLGTCRNLYLEALYLEPRNLRNLTWNPYLEPRNLPEPLLGTNLPEPLLGTLTWNLGARRKLYLEPLLGTSEPAGTFTWNPYLNLGTCRNPYLEPLLGTSEPARTWRDDCPRVPQGLVWLGPQSFQLLGNKPMLNPNSYAIITGKNQWGIQTDRDLQGTLTWTCLEPSLETFCLKPWNLLQRLLGTLIYLEHGNLFLEPLLAWNLHWKSLAWNLETLEPHASLSWRTSWNQYLELGAFWYLLEPSFRTCSWNSEPLPNACLEL